MSKPKLYPDSESYRKDYNSRPEVKEKQKLHIQKYRSKPEVRERLRTYNREYMRDYWKKNPEKYAQQIARTIEASKKRTMTNETD